MSLYKRGNTWWVHFAAPNGERVRHSAHTEDRAEAQEYHDRLKAAYWRVTKLKDRPRRTWQEAVVKWVQESGDKATLHEDIAKFQWLDPFLHGKHLDEIDRELIETIASRKEAEGVMPATVNRYLALVRAVLRKAWSEWGWIDGAPKVRMRKEPKRRVRFLTRDEATRLLAELPEHLAEMARFALATGLREANVVGLRWTELDLARRIAWVHPDQAKAEKAIGVPLNAEALGAVQRQAGNHPESVFTYRGRALRRCSSRAWYRALKRAGIVDFRWHDWRHTWASWHAQAGTPISVLQELGGWNGPQMVQRYAHLTVDHLAPYAERVTVNDTNTTQSSRGGGRETL